MRGTVLTLVVTVAGLGPWAAAAADLGDLKRRGTLRVVAAADEMPENFSFAPSGDPGFEREMLADFARIHGLQIEALAVKTYAERIPALLGGAADVIAGLGKSAERERQVDFTVWTLPLLFVAGAWAPRPAPSLDDVLAGRVGVLAGTTWGDAALEAGVRRDRLVSFDRLPDLLAALEAGQVDTTVMTAIDLMLAAKREPNLRVGATIKDAGFVYWGVRKEDDQLERALNSYLASFRGSGAWDRLLVKYYGRSARQVMARPGPS